MIVPLAARILVGVGAAVLALAGFLAYTAARAEVLLYGLVGAAVFLALALVIVFANRKDKAQPPEPRPPEKA